jgi:hypothetical protein
MARFEESRRCYDRLLALDPSNASGRYHRSLLLLRAGEFEQGWIDYERRFASGLVAEPVAATPRWRGQAVDRLLLIAEQGLGDAIHFARFAPMLRQRARTLTLACDASLADLLARSLPIDAVVGMDARQWPEHDAHLPLMSAPLALELGAQAACFAAPYLSPDPRRLDQWRSRLPRSGVLRIGVAWAASSGHPTEATPYTRRSCPLAALAPLARLPGIAVHSVQLGPARAELDASGAPPFDDLSASLHSFDDTAAALRCLDAVVSVDTSVAHLAGALGTPAHLLLPVSANWQWTTDAQRTPWYRSLHLARQSTPADWGPAVDAVARRLLAQAHTNGGAP